MNRLLIFQSMMGLTVVCGLFVSAWLAKHAQQNRYLLPLAGFNAAMAIWCLGQWMLTVDKPGIAIVLLNINPLMPTLFLHFALSFLTAHVPNALLDFNWRRFMPWIYALSTIVIVFSINFSGNYLKPWLDFPLFLHLGQLGWGNIIYTLFIGLLAHGVLVLGFIAAKGNVRRAIVLIFAAGAWGFTMASSYLIASMGVALYPYFLWFMPSYLLLLTFAVLRYQMLAVNYWAIKTIVWSLVVLVLLVLTTLITSIASPLGLPLLSEVPLSVLWLYSTITALVLWMLYKPLQQLASRLVYPDVDLNEAVMDKWLENLNAAHSFSELQDLAKQEISKHIKQKVVVAINQPSNTTHLTICCDKQADKWFFSLENWQDVTPGIRQAAEIFASLLVSVCDNLDKSLLLAQQEQQRQEELRLVELGALAASMAHELRNPLNIISMASAQCEDKVKDHIQTQLSRADTLIQDLLSYARVIELSCQKVSLFPLLQALKQSIEADYKIQVDIECDCHFSLWADGFRLQQVLTNLLDNAAAFSQAQPNGRVLIQCSSHQGIDKVTVHNNGPAIAKTMRGELFKPFISKRPGGSGLGLAIVARIIKAHRGKVYFSDQLGWPVSFVIELPKQEISGE